MDEKNYKWRALALLWVAFFLQQGTRQLFGPSVPAMCASFGVDKVAIGVVGTVFAMTYGVCVPFAGLTADLFNRKWMVTIGVGVFCLGIFASGFVASVGLLILTYGILNGFGQTFYYPSATSLVSQLHKESRATAISILQLGLYVGIVGCGGLAGFVAGKGGENWRVPFWIFGGIGLAWAVALAFFLKDTKPVAVEGRQKKPSIGEAVKAVFSKPTALCVILGLAMMIYVDIGFKNWMPAYLRENFGDACPYLRHWAGLHAVLWHYLGAILGVLAGSRIGDRLVKGRPGIRLELGVAGLGLAIPFIVWMATTQSFALCCVAMFGFGLFRGVYDSNFMASFFDVVNPRYHASGVGVMMCIAFLFGSLSSTVLPWLEKALGGDMGRSMASLAGFYLVGAAVVLVARVAFQKKDLERS
ncbi:MAG: MFS transporter [Kiritimatiellae bacterium]|nr:MFS transporter [Kiritimatiellia bacterium]